MTKINQKFFQKLEYLSEILKQRQDRIPKYFNFKPLDLANMNDVELLDLYDKYSEIMVYLYLDDKINSWNAYKVIIEGIFCNIFYGVNNPFCEDHGHYTVYINSGKFYYRRRMYEPHGKQNFVYE